MTESRRDRWLSIALSVLLHGALIGLLVFGWLHLKEKAPPPTLSIDATVVNARTLKGVGFATQPTPKPAPKPAPPQPTPVPQGPPVPTPQEQALREQAAQAEARHQAEAQQALEKRQAAQQAQQAEKARQKAKAVQAAQAEQKVKEAARKKAQQLAEAKKRAEEKKLAEAKKLAEEKKLAAERAAEQKAARAAALAELQHNLRQEEQNNAATQAGLASWTQEIEGRIEDAWIRPPTANSGIDCVLNVTQVPGGAVTNVSIGRCNGDGAVKESIEAAVYRASPLPPPPDPSLFQRQLIIEFKPN